jgi:hypothetical protein
MFPKIPLPIMEFVPCCQLNAAPTMKFATNGEHDISQVHPSPVTHNNDEHIQSATPGCKLQGILWKCRQPKKTSLTKRFLIQYKLCLNNKKYHVCHTTHLCFTGNISIQNLP